MQNLFSLNDRNWQLIGKMFSKEAADDELKELHHIQLSDPEAAFYIREISKWWWSTEAVGGDEAEKAFQKHLQRMQDEKLFLLLSLMGEPKPFNKNFCKKLLFCRMISLRALVC